MGLDGTIKSANGEPLGPTSVVMQALSEAFPGISFGPLPSGNEKLRAATQQGIEFPEAIRKHFESAPASLGGDYEGQEFSAQFNLGPRAIVQQVDVVLYGNTVASEPMFAILRERYKWVVTHP